MASKIGEIQHDRGYEFMRVPDKPLRFDLGAHSTPAPSTVGAHSDYQPPTETVPIGAWPFPPRKRT